LVFGHLFGNQSGNYFENGVKGNHRPNGIQADGDYDYYSVNCGADGKPCDAKNESQGIADKTPVLIKGVKQIFDGDFKRQAPIQGFHERNYKIAPQPESPNVPVVEKINYPVD
jgi:hypothetical protein